VSRLLVQKQALKVWKSMKHPREMKKSCSMGWELEAMFLLHWEKRRMVLETLGEGLQ
jgi:hypothetical protein